MGLERELEALRRRVQRVAPLKSPPELKVHVFKEGNKNPTSGSQWELSIMIENKKEDNLSK
tara:strand:+ start:163 stop:345 length:183 start_codon:yes stop_codon:yes gene_type:complete